MTSEDNNTTTEARSEYITKNMLRFTCPECGSHRLEEVVQMRHEIEGVYDPEDPDYDWYYDPEEMVVITRTVYSSFTEDNVYRCYDCEAELRDSQGHTFWETEYLYRLLKGLSIDEDDDDDDEDDDDGESDAKRVPGAQCRTVRTTQTNSETNHSVTAPLGEQKELQFTCPLCKGHSLYLKQIDLTEVTSLYNDGEIELGHEYPEDDLGFVCHCGYELRDENSPVIGGRHLAEWVLKNCPQPADDVPVTKEEPLTDT